MRSIVGTWIALTTFCVAVLLAGASATGKPPQDKAKPNPKPATGDKWDVSKADPAERESKRTEVWPDNYTPPASVTWVKDVIYGSPGGHDLDLDIIMRREQPKTSRPAIVFIHGGSWKHGNKHQFRRQAARLADRYDIFGACIFYRLSGEFDMFDLLEKGSLIGAMDQFFGGSIDAMPEVCRRGNHRGLTCWLEQSEPVSRRTTIVKATGRGSLD